jgi:tripartite-type tricarboxylate transporter receptor subunit TctC
MHRSVKTLAAVALCALAAAPASFAQDNYPTKPVTLIVPWPAGGSTDVVMRAMSEVAARHLGQPISVENKAGASGTLGPAAMAATARPDGYTIAQMAITMYRFPAMKDRQVTWDPFKDFSYIIHLTGYTFGITTKADGPFKEWKDVVAYAKANPGKVTYATPGAGTSLHIGMEMIAAAAGIKLTQVPFKGGAETNAAVLGGHTLLQADSTGWRPLVDAGQLRLLALWTAERSKFWPNVPTLKELGYPFVFDSPFGLAGPKGMDPKVVKKLHDAYKKALEDKSVIDLMDKFVMVPRYADPEGYRRIVKEISDSERDGLTRLGLAK